jgi:hypothetical protein
VTEPPTVGTRPPVAICPETASQPTPAEQAGQAGQAWQAWTEGNVYSGQSSMIKGD